MTVPAIILAAGASTRLGRPKQLVRLGEEFLVERALRIALDAGCHPVLVVLGAHADEISARCCLEPATIIIHPQWQQGMASSIQAGLQALAQDCPGVIVTTCDQPAVTSTHLRALMSYPTEIVASSYAQKNGVPAYFPGPRFPHLRLLSADTGARDLLRSVRAIPLEGGELDIDTADTLALAQSRFAKPA